MDATISKRLGEGLEWLPQFEWLEEMKKSDPVQYHKYILVLRAVKLYQEEHKGKGMPIDKDLTILFEYMATVMMDVCENVEERNEI